jgi:multiple sugar transport system ATP-binding protein
VLSDGELQQLAPPDEIYDRPQNRFVATFVGSPAMNVLPGAVDPAQRAFAVAGVPLPLGDAFEACAAAGVVELGARPEDLRLVEPGTAGALPGEVYVVEPMGNEALVDVTVDGTRITVRSERDFRAPIGSPIGVAVDGARCCFFTSEGATAVQRRDRQGSPARRGAVG